MCLFSQVKSSNAKIQLGDAMAKASSKKEKRLISNLAVVMGKVAGF